MYIVCIQQHGHLINYYCYWFGAIHGGAQVVIPGGAWGTIVEQGSVLCSCLASVLSLWPSMNSPAVLIKHGNPSDSNSLLE